MESCTIFERGHGRSFVRTVHLLKGVRFEVGVKDELLDAKNIGAGDSVCVWNETRALPWPVIV
jgi:hypothetical protein